jgi:DMSO/TMAO reductase YedYZ molybdopterin-dependent catalytic subunit
MFPNPPRHLTRRDLITKAAALGVGGVLAPWRALAGETVTLPFANGVRPLATFPQKRPLILQTSRPPQLETPFSVFDEGIFTPNDAFFVRYHLAGIPTEIDVETFRVAVGGAVKTPLTHSVADLKKNFDPVEIAAVNQCSGNSRGFSQPRVPGGQLANGAMGNARWKGVRLKDVLEKAGIAAGAKQVTFDGLDTAAIPKTPDFVKALDIDHALDGEVMLAWEMNGADLPMLNGYPLRLVVPGYYGTYWVKHVNRITVTEDVFNGFWMNPAYRIPDTPGACVPPGTKPGSTVPIARFNVRSFITNPADGAVLHAGRETKLRGIAFDGGAGITEVAVSSDGGKTWREARLGKDHGNYSFREWTAAFTPKKAGPLDLRVRATNRIGESQPAKPLWNPAGYMRNVIESIQVTVAA